jgi:hypothetical protein
MAGSMRVALLLAAVACCLAQQLPQTGSGAASDEQALIASLPGYSPEGSSSHNDATHNAMLHGGSRRSNVVVEQHTEVNMKDTKRHKPADYDSTYYGEDVDAYSGGRYAKAHKRSSKYGSSKYTHPKHKDGESLYEDDDDSPESQEYSYKGSRKHGKHGSKYGSKYGYKHEDKEDKDSTKYPKKHHAGDYKGSYAPKASPSPSPSPAPPAPYGYAPEPPPSPIPEHHYLYQPAEEEEEEESYKEQQPPVYKHHGKKEPEHKEPPADSKHYEEHKPEEKKEEVRVVLRGAVWLTGWRAAVIAVQCRTGQPAASAGVSCTCRRAPGGEFSSLSACLCVCAVCSSPRSSLRAMSRTPVATQTSATACASRSSSATSFLTSTATQKSASTCPSASSSCEQSEKGVLAAQAGAHTGQGQQGADCLLLSCSRLHARRDRLLCWTQHTVQVARVVLPAE